jgi:hypothetical protein
MTRPRYPSRRAGEDRYPHRVDVPVPPTGLDGRLSGMHNWCYEHVLPGGWEEHGHSDERRDERGIRIDFCRFYFLDEAGAEAFRREWAPDA